mmetsp:Transcript_23117/g.34337  ORF Transcript_23117/g.34337 Transcript_23117/m.34337 type:complete len:202 (-) Transcript_23117:596-1201(-)
MYGIKDRGEEEESNAPTAVTRSGKLGLSGFSNSSTRLVWSARLWTVTRISDALIRKIDLHKLVDWQCALARVSSCVHNANAASNIFGFDAVAVNSFHEFLFSPCSSKEFLSSLFFAAITSLNCFSSETLVLVNPVCFSGLLTIPIRSLIFLLLALISKSAQLSLTERQSSSRFGTLPDKNVSALSPHPTTEVLTVSLLSMM